MRHNCEFISSWCQDERVPIEFRHDTETFVLKINSELEVPLNFCAWCGDPLCNHRAASLVGKPDCEHIRELEAIPNSAIKFHPEDGLHYLIGDKALAVRLFFCPICGTELQRPSSISVQISESEINRLRGLFAHMQSLDEVIQRVGEPDSKRGPVKDHIYWKGEREEITFGRSLFYHRLAETINVHVIENSDGTVDVKYIAKEKKVGRI